MFLLVLHLRNIRKLFIHSSDVYAYNTRFSCADNLFAQKSRLHMKLKFFPASGSRLWNCLHPDWRKLTKRAFKRKIHNLNSRIELNKINYYPRLVYLQSLAINVSIIICNTVDSVIGFQSLLFILVSLILYIVVVQLYFSCTMYVSLVVPIPHNIYMTRLDQFSYPRACINCTFCFHFFTNVPDSNCTRQ